MLRSSLPTGVRSPFGKAYWIRDKGDSSMAASKKKQKEKRKARQQQQSQAPPPVTGKTAKIAGRRNKPHG